MNTRTAILAAATSACLSGLLTSCASTRVEPDKARQRPYLEQPAPQQILVLAVLGSPTSRRAVEDELVRQLQQAGIRAMPGYSVSPETGEIATPRLAQTLATCGADAALVCRWHQVKQVTWMRSRKSRAAHDAGRGQRRAYGTATLLAGQAADALWSAATTLDQHAGFRDAAPGFAKALVNSIQKAGALHGGATADAPTRGALAKN